MQSHVVSLLFLLALLWPASAAPSQEVAKKTLEQKAIEKLFEVGWDASVQARQETDRVYRRIGELRVETYPVQYAHALALIKQRRYSEASSKTDSLVKSRPADLHARRMRIWLSVLMKDHATAMAHTDELAKLLPGEKAPLEETKTAPETAAETEGWDHARFLGAAFGFWEGPAAGQVSEAPLEGQRRLVLAKLTPGQREAFDHGMAAVMERFSSLLEAEGETRERNIEEEKKFRDKLQVDLKDRTKKIEADRNKLATRREQLRKQIKEELYQLDEKERPLLSRLQRLDAAAASTRRELFDVRSDIGRLEADLARERDPAIRASLLRSIDRLDLIARRYDRDFRSMEREAAGINLQRAQIHQQRRQSEAVFARDLGVVDKELAGLRRQDKRLQGQSRKLTRPNTGSNLQTRTLAAQARAFSKYEPFPLEQEKQRMMKVAAGAVKTAK